MKLKTALSIAGSDPSGGAGIQADLKTMTVNGVYAMSVLTALTAQNTTGVSDILEVEPAFLEKQLDMVFDDIFPDAVKTGMVSSEAHIEVIAACLKNRQAKNIVVDPVMVSTSGAALLRPSAIGTLKKKLFPLADIITPNISEAELLSGGSIGTEKDMEAAARKIFDDFGCGVLLKGGHNVNDANDFFYNGAGCWFRGERIANPNTHGTGCTLSSAIAANLAKGLSAKEAIGKAKEYISGALGAMLDLGKGRGPMHHGYVLEKREG